MAEWLLPSLWSVVGISGSGAFWYFLSIHAWKVAWWTAVLAVGLLLFTIGLHIWNGRPESAGVQIQRVKKFNPAQIVVAYDAGTSDYLPVNADPELKSLLADGHDVLITGRPGIGKSHAAVTHIKQAFPGWFIVRPGRNAIQLVASMKFKRRKYVLLLDDLDDYVPDSEEITTVLDAVDHLRQIAERLVVVATLRSTAPEFNTLAMIPKLSGRWQIVELEDWSMGQGQDLAQLTRSSFASWDGTPLSVKRPSKEMRIRYEQASAEQKQILALIKTLHDYGIRPVRLALLERLTSSPSKSMSAETPIRERVETLRHLGFLKRGETDIEAYAPYLESVDASSSIHVQVLVDVLCELHLIPELIRLGQRFVANGIYGQAVETYRRAIELEPLQERLHYRLGIALARQNNMSEAAQEFDRATQLSPGWASAWWRLGAVLAKQGLTTRAVEAFGHAKVRSRLDPPTRRCLRVATLRAAGYFDEALREIDDVIATSPELSLAWFEKGRALSDSRRYDLAILSFRQAAQLEPTMAEAYFGIARPLREIGDSGGAERAYRESLVRNPKIADSHAFLATLLWDSDRLGEAEEEIKTAISLKPWTPEFHSYYGQLLGRRRDPVAMEREFREALRLRPNYVEALIGLAAALRMQNRVDEAIEANERAIELDSLQSSAHLGLGLCLFNKRDHSGAAEQFRRAVELDGKIAPAYFYLGRTLLLMGKAEEAISELRKAEERRYSRGKVQWHLAKAFAMLGFHQDAIRALRAASSARFVIDSSRLATDRTFRALTSHPDWSSLIAELNKHSTQSTTPTREDA